jgi:predicted metal-dependent phosphoesterase TrpH
MLNLKLDLHIHSFYSNDSYIKPSNLFDTLKKKDLDGFSITDHDIFRKSSFFKKRAKSHNLIYVPGIEVQTDFGDVLLLFLKEQIDLKNNNFFAIAEKAKDQNALVILAHPFDFLRRTSFNISKLTIEEIEKFVDGIEVMNSRIIMKHSVIKARNFGEKNNLIMTGGSDAHTISEVGHGYTLAKNCEDRTTESIYNAMVSKRSCGLGKLSNPFVHLLTKLYKLRKKLNNI